jgi:polysaccharide biosynthesis transport protein
MAVPQGPRPATATWLSPRPELEGFARYFATIRERWWLVAVVTALTVLAALAYVATATKTYDAEADLLVTPVVQGDASTTGLGLITESNDPTQVVTTAARLVKTPAVAQLTQQRQHVGGRPTDLLDDITVEPVAQSNLVAVKASASSAAGAQRLADGFAQAAVDARTSLLHQQLDALIPKLQEQINTLPQAERSGAGTLGQRIADLQALRAGQDPTLRVASRATLPVSPSSPKPKLALAAGLIGGLILGLGAAFLSQTLDPRLRREAQLRDRFRLPVLARIPDRRSQRRDGPVPPGGLPVDALEAFRTLRATLVATIGDEARTILVTSSAGGEGKTTTALNLAYAFAQAGYETVLLEADLRRPTLGRAIGHQSVQGLESVLIGQARLEDALFRVSGYGDNLEFLLAGHGGVAAADRLSLPAARELISTARGIADYVIIDAPPLTEVVDALPLAQQVDAVLMIGRIGVSRLNRLTDLGEMLQAGGIVPCGIALLSGDHLVESSYYLTPAGGRPQTGRAERVA